MDDQKDPNPFNLEPSFGLIAELANLNSKPELNGRRGMVLERLENGRFRFKDIASGNLLSIKRENLLMEDPVIEMVAADKMLMSDDTCDVFQEKFVSKAKSNANANVSERQSCAEDHKSFVSDCIEKVGMEIEKIGESALISVTLAGLGHHFILQILRVDEEIAKDKIFLSEKLENAGIMLSARLLHCWTKSVDSSRNLQSGFTVGEWLSRKHTTATDSTNLATKFGWMCGKDLKRFCENMDKLKRVLHQVVESDLIHNAAQFCDADNITALRLWASREKTKGASPGVGLTLQPGRLVDADSYVSGMLADGYPAMAVVFTGLTSGNPKQLLAFPASKLKTIFQLTLDLFGVEVSASTFLSVLEWWRHPLAWSFQVLRI